MRRSLSLDLVKREVRSGVCARCERRPSGSERWDPVVPRSCEAECPLFAHLPRLARLAEAVDPMVGSRRAVLRRAIGWTRRASAGRNDTPVASPLRRHRRRLVAILDRVADR
jgi:hypothetical protein